ncbi:hypothetical protein SEA_GAIL_91 [Mycobacterium phage Gail]|uniref:Uncharacterized protein n=1 Tax=Mycobacterium phage Gail TaxID=2743994 RepID=A0A7D5JM33_9CAUD|nr:hypothetical protein KNV16_gp018 [Mycobacterium phage Gail]QLF84654.1 hypothetical protein SEA_GAIL_91 [Mycobacterium phage Gail]
MSTYQHTDGQNDLFVRSSPESPDIWLEIQQGKSDLVHLMSRREARELARYLMEA